MPAIKRELQIVKHKTMFKIIWTGGGETPDYLKGLFTCFTEAEKRLNIWDLIRKEKITKAKPRKKAVNV